MIVIIIIIIIIIITIIIVIIMIIIMIIIITIIIIMTANLGVQNGYLLGNWVTDHGNDNNYDDNNITISQYSDLWIIEGQ